MIGLVIVSHSRKLSEGLKEMAEAMTQAPVRIASAGGMDEPEEALGTDALRVMKAVRSVASAEGVLIFADVGSARLSAEMAIDLLDEPERAKVTFCDAPLVEGVLAATVQIAAGGTLKEVIREARGGAALVQLSQEGGVSSDFVVTNRLGLHARPAAKFVEAISRIAGEVHLINLTKGKPAANAKSINGVMLSEVSGNDEIRLVARDATSDTVFDEIAHLLADNFGEDGVTPAAEPPVPTDCAARNLAGVPVAKGFAVGPLHHVARDLPDIAPTPITDPASEVAAFEQALAAAEAEIRAQLNAAEGQFSAYDRKIFEAHIAYLHDPDIRKRVQDEITTRKLSAAAIWREIISDLIHGYTALQDPAMAARAADVLDVGQRVLRLLAGAGEAVDFDTSVILAFDELLPSDVLGFSSRRILGICTTAGGKTSHAGILAASLPVPVVFALGAALASLPDGEEVMLDGAAGQLVRNPDPKEKARLETERATWQARQALAEEVRFEPAITADGHKVRVAANMASLEETGLIAKSGAEEVGLLRTEFLFMRRPKAPTEAEQYEIYRTILEGLDSKPLTVRTIDIGGDKPVPYMARPAEANPNLGWRGIRHSLDVPALFDTQLGAILRASAHGPVRIMFPLVSTLAELEAARAHVDTVKTRLRGQGQAFAEEIEVGIMVEVPAAAEMAHVLAPQVDFFSIGTNDLTQYTMAADRANPKVQTLFDPFNPAVLKMVQKSITAAHCADIWIGMCGAMAGSPLAAPVLVGMGLDEFSMAPADIAEFKLTVRDLNKEACGKLAEDVLTLTSAAQVRDRISAFLAG